MAKPEHRTFVFAKYPEPGRVKTRMVPPLVPKEAAALHLASLRVVCQRLATLPHVAATLVVTPDDRCEELRRSVGLPGWNAWSQGDGELGIRLERTVRRAFEESSTAVLLLGADSPTLPLQYVHKAIVALGEHDVALGPCEDGGYYLLALRRPCSALFEGVEWGGARVAEQTRANARAAGLRLFELPLWYDLDRVEDLHRAAADRHRMNDTPGPAVEDLRRLLAELALQRVDEDPRS